MAQFYQSKEEAMKDAKFIIKDNRLRGNKKSNQPKKLRSYLCPYCGKWHLTSRKQHKWK